MPDSDVFEHHPESTAIRAWLDDRYRLAPEVLDAYALWHRVGRPAIWMARRGVVLPVGPVVQAVGLMVMRKPPPSGKPTSVFLQRVGAHARRNAVDLEMDRVPDFLAGESLEVDAPEARGHVVVRCALGVLGCGWLEEGRRLVSQLPGSWVEGTA